MSERTTDELPTSGGRATGGERATGPVASPGDGARPGDPPGADARSPAGIPPRGWRQIVVRAYQESVTDNVSMLAGGVAFFAFLALFPALIALVSVYGLVASPEEVTAQVQSIAAGLPASAQPLVADQLTAVATSGTGALTTGLIIAVLAALFSASSGTQNLMTAVNLAYDETESRNFLRLRGTALALTLGAVVFVVVTLALVAVVPALLDGLPLVGRILGQVVRWVLLLGLVAAALAVVYRVGPDRASPRFRWVSPGAAVATVLWIAGSVVFSVYINNFSSYNKTYGALAGVVVLMLWLYLTSYIVLLGAEINAEAEQQTRHDSTTGEPRPMGRRGAIKADTMPAP